MNRMLYIFGSIFYLIYWYVGSTFLNIKDPLIFRLVVVIEVSIIFILTFYIESLKRNLQYANQIIMHTMNINVIYLVVINNLSTNIIIFLIIYVGLLILFVPYTFVTVRSFNLYSLITASELISAFYLINRSLSTKLIYGSILSIFLLIVYITIIPTIEIRRQYITTSNRLDFIINNSPIILFILDNKGIFQLSKGRGLVSLGLEENEVVGTSVYDFAEGFPEILKMVDTALTGNKTRKIIEFGDIIFDSFFAPYIQNGQQKGVIGLGLDVTDQYRALDKLKEKEKLILRNQKLEVVGKLASGIAHDFNNLLSIISLNNELIQFAIDSGHYKGIENQSQEIQNNVDRASYLTDRLLNISKSKIDVPKIVSLNKIIRNQEPVLRSALKEDIDLIINYPNEEYYTIIDPGQVDQILLNLILNARDAIGYKSNGKIRININSDEANKDEYVKIKIEDNGVGMTEHVMDHLFEPFYTTKEEGSGLGLYSVKNIIEKANGIISVNTEQNVGTEFIIYLPKAVNDFDTIDLESDIVENKLDLDISDIRILIVEDKQPLRLTLEHVLKKMGFKTESENNGYKAMQRIQNGFETDILITDIILPGINGIDLAEQALKHYPKLKVLFISGFTGELNKQVLAKDNVSFIKKPFTSKQLIKKFKELFGE